MRLTKNLLGLLLAGTTLAAVPGCASSGRAVVVASYEDPPPPPREEYVTHRPGYVWIHGSWVRDANDQWRWRSGYFVRERPGYVYVPGRWVRNNRQYIWIDGGWRAEGEVVIRGRGRY
jgi:hypothetical protein